MFPMLFAVSIFALEEASFPFLYSYREELFKEQKLIFSVHRRHNETGSTHAVKITEYTNFTEKGKCFFLVLFCYSWLKHDIGN